jgi:hypothetical protein
MKFSEGMLDIFEEKVRRFALPIGLFPRVQWKGIIFRRYDGNLT